MFDCKGMEWETAPYFHRPVSGSKNSKCPGCGRTTKCGALECIPGYKEFVQMVWPGGKITTVFATISCWWNFWCRTGFSENLLAFSFAFFNWEIAKMEVSSKTAQFYASLWRCKVFTLQLPFFHCFRDEDFVGLCKRLAVRVHKGPLFEYRIMARWLLRLSSWDPSWKLKRCGMWRGMCKSWFGSCYPELNMGSIGMYRKKWVSVKYMNLMHLPPHSP